MLAFARAMAEAAGLCVHLYTSPHLIHFHERIRLGRGPGRSSFIAEPDLIAVLEECEAANRGEPITFFEITTAAAFLAFARAPADLLLLEVGLGGRLDATNLVEGPAVCAVTPVAVDHTGFLGEVLADIAFEKAGILKAGVPAVIGVQEPEVLAVLEARGGAVGAPLLLHGRDWGVAEDGRGLRVYAGARRVHVPRPELAGRHQWTNAAHALACLEAARIAVDDAAAALGVAEVSWPGRLQRLDGGPLAAHLPARSELWLDGAHNPGAARTLAAFLAELPPRPAWLVAGMLQTKDAAGFLAALAPWAAGLVAVPVPGSDLGLPPATMARIAAQAGLDAGSAQTLASALDAIANRAPEGARVLICGSLYLAGAALGTDGRAVA